MCGIVGYIGNQCTNDILIDGLKELEYRGYDSAGIAVLQNGNINIHKALGKIVTKKPIIPTKEEEKQNPRSRSSKMRVFGLWVTSKNC